MLLLSILLLLLLLLLLPLLLLLLLLLLILLLLPLLLLLMLMLKLLLLMLIPPYFSGRAEVGSVSPQLRCETGTGRSPAGGPGDWQHTQQPQEIRQPGDGGCRGRSWEYIGIEELE